MLFIAILFVSLLPESSGTIFPQCGNTNNTKVFCFSPSEFSRIIVQVVENGTKLDVEYKKASSREASEFLEFYQNAKLKAEVPCHFISKTDLCLASLPLDFFDKAADFVIKVNNITSEKFKLDGFNIVPATQGGSSLTKEQRRLLCKVHAILMLIGWLFLLPTALLFARLGRDIFKEQKLLGMAVWFQVHRAASFLGVLCICISIFCVFLMTDFSWKGTGSTSRYWTQWHTDLGVISSILAVAQPLNSLLRCPPSDAARRAVFNWAHRGVGIVSYSTAVAALIIAGFNFQKIWNELVLVLILLALPTLLCIAAVVGFPILERRKLEKKNIVSLKNLEPAEEPFLKNHTIEPHVLRIPFIFWSIGVFFASTLALSFLILNGFKQ